MGLRLKGFVFLGFVSLVFSINSNATIPNAHIKGIDELFPKEYKILSPLTGLLFHDSFVKELMEQRQSEQIGELASQLFVKIPDAEIATTHMMNLPGAHLSAGAIGDILGAYETLRNKNLGEQDLAIQLKAQFKDAIVFCDEYQKSLIQAQKNIGMAKLEYDKFLQRLEAEKDQSNQVVQFERTLVKLRKKVKSFKPTSRGLTTDSVELLQAEQDVKDAELRLSEMTKNMLTVEEKKEAKNEWKHQQSLNDVSSAAYQKRLDQLIDSLVKSFLQYESKEQPSPQLSNATTLTLLSYMWMKFTDKADLRGYIDALATRGALDGSALAKLDSDFYTRHYTPEDYKKIRSDFPYFYRDAWVTDHFADAVIATSESGGDAKFPGILQFSYWKWVTYNRYADCCESAIHNIFNLMAYNPETNEIDYRMLESLRDKYYPHMSERLINYYKKYTTLEQHDTSQAGGDWLDVMSHLNDGIPNLSEDETIAYGLGTVRNEVKPPNLNLFKVIHRLLGYESIVGDHMAEIFQRVKDTTGFEVAYSTGKDSTEVFFGIGKNKFVLNSYGNWHVTYNLLKDKGDELSQTIIKIITKKASQSKEDKAHQLRFIGARDYLSY